MSAMWFTENLGLQASLACHPLVSPFINMQPTQKPRVQTQSPRVRIEYVIESMLTLGLGDTIIIAIDGSHGQE